MSWSTFFQTTGATLENDLQEALQRMDVTAEHVKDQVAVAFDQVRLAIRRGAVGVEDKRFSVSINGHANPGHEPADGFADETISCAVTQLKPVDMPAPANADVPSQPVVPSEGAGIAAAAGSPSEPQGTQDVPPAQEAANAAGIAPAVTA